MQHQAGFSLLELAIFITVISIAAVGALEWLAPPTKTEAERLRVTRDRMQAIEKALVAYRFNYGRLPCAAPRAVADDQATAGLEDCSGIDQTAENNDTISTCTRTLGGDEQYGVVPVRTLGIPYENIRDGWGRRFSYHISEALCPIGTCTASDYESNEGALELRGRDSGGTYQVKATDGAFVILSFGADGNCAWLDSGEQQDGPSGGVSAVNAITIADAPMENIDAGDGIYWLDRYSADFNDLVLFRSKRDIEYRVLDLTDIVDQTLCSNSTTLLSNFSRADYNNIANDAYAGTVSADDVLAVLWEFQELCAEYFPDNYDGDPAANTRKCPGSAADGIQRIYNDGAGGCICPATAPNWDGTECST